MPEVLDRVAFEETGLLHVLLVWRTLAMHGGRSGDQLVIFVTKILAPFVNTHNTEKILCQFLNFTWTLFTH